MKHHACRLICPFASLLLLMQLDASFSFAGNGRESRSQSPRQNSDHPTPEHVFHTDVPERLFDVTLARPTDRSVTVVVSAYNALELNVEYGTKPGDYFASTSPRRCKRGDTVQLPLSRLKSNTRYYYRVRYQVQGTPWTESSPESTFHTQRPPGEPFCFTVQADSHLDGQTDLQTYLQTLNNAVRAMPDFHMDLGDTFMTDKYRPNFRDAEAQYYAQRYYFAQIGQVAPLFLVLGNHDGEAGWFYAPGDNNISLWSHRLRTRLFPNPIPSSFYSGNTTQVPGLGHLEDYYAWRWGDAHFIVLDPFWPTLMRGRSVNDGWRWTLGQEQFNWLRKTLGASDATFKFVFIHNLVGGNDEAARGGVEAAPFFEWGGRDFNGAESFDKHRPGFDQPIHRLLVDNGVSIVFHGHDHFFARQELDGMIYQLVPQPGHASKQRAEKEPGRRRGKNASEKANHLAADYGYVSGDIIAGSGCLRVTISPKQAILDFLLSDGDDSAATIGFSYKLTPNSPYMTEIK